MDEHEERERGGFRIAAGIFDFFGVIGSAVLILVLLAIMASLFSWVKQDLTETFAGIGENINEAVVIDADTATQRPVSTTAPQAQETLPPVVQEQGIPG